MQTHSKLPALHSQSSAPMRTVRAVDRAIDILMYVARQDGPKGLSEISRELKLDKATVLRLILTLKSRGLIRQIEDSRSYELVLPGPLLIGATEPGLRQICHPYLERLFRQTGETVCLVCPWGFERTHVDVIPARHELRLVPEIGSIWPIYVGASGRVMMAFMPREKVENIIRETKLAPRNATHVPTKDEILYELIHIRRRGYLISAGETVEGGAAVAAPVIDRNDRVVGAIAIRGPTTRMSPPLLRKYAPLVKDAARRLSRELGFDFDPLSIKWQEKLGWIKNPMNTRQRAQTNYRIEPQPIGGVRPRPS
jgi:IclR family KDG regulon transcriptional repressor